MGYVGLDRGIIDHWIYQDAEYFKVWFEMLHRARYGKEPYLELVEGELIEINHAEFIFGRIKWSKRLKVSEQRLRTLIKKLIAEDMIEVALEHRKCTVYRIKNYAKFNQQSNQQNDQSQQGFEEHANHQNNLHLTSSQPAANQQPTTKEESNKVNKVNKVKKETIYTPQFDEFWSSYPKPVEKVDCFTTWQKIIKDGEAPEIIIQCAKNYGQYCTDEQTESKFIKHPKTFLNKRRYEEYLLPKFTLLKGGQADASKPEQRRPPTANQYYANDPSRGSTASVQSAASGGSDYGNSQYDLDMFVRR